MKVFQEISLRDFDFWSGAKDTASYLTVGDLDQIEEILEDCYNDGISETQINDIFWFEPDTIAEWLGYEDWDDFVEKKSI